jgi:heme exporter protein D
MLLALAIQVVVVSIRLATMSKTEKKQLMNSVKAMKKARNNALRANSKSGSKK